MVRQNPSLFYCFIGDTTQCQGTTSAVARMLYYRCGQLPLRESLMKKFFAVLCLLFSAATLQAKNTPDQAEYTIKVHISASTIPNLYSVGIPVMIAEAILNGKKIELSGNAVLLDDRNQIKSGNNAMLIVPGDYQARLIKEVHNSDSTLIHQEYDILLTDGIVWHCITNGIYE